MTMRMYIARLDDPSFSWQHYFPDFFDWVKTKQCEWKQVDWGGWVAKVRKADIIEFVEFCYGSDPSYTDPGKMLRWEGKTYLVDRLTDLKRFIDNLEDDAVYALCRCGIMIRSAQQCAGPDRPELRGSRESACRPLSVSVMRTGS